MQVTRLALALGASAIAFLYRVRGGLKPLLRWLGFGPRMADPGPKTGPVLTIVATTLAVWALDLGAHGVALVGEVPQSLPPLTLSSFSPDLISQLALPALLISIIRFVESISVAQTLAAKKRQRIDPDQELIGLGAANLGAAFTGGFRGTSAVPISPLSA